MEIFYTRNAVADLTGLPKADQKRVAEKMKFYGETSNPLKFAERLSGAYLGQFRFRIGNYRVIFDVAENKIWVLKIAKRDKVYK